ncbi:MAG: TatD DNase family protein [Myxococcota bacterium]|jgi:TatD DNase family protein
MPTLYRRGFDAHTHVGEAAFDVDRMCTVQRAHDRGVSGLAMATGNPDRLPLLREIAAQMGLVLSVGLHPWWVRADTTVENVVQMLDDNDPAAVGEVGLDRLHPNWKEQGDIFAAQLDWAHRHSRPAVVHAVRSVDAVLAECGRRPGLRMMIHGFTGSVQQVQKASELGVYLSIGPTSLRATGRTIAVIRAIPSSLLLLETDAPHHPLHDGERGEPADLVHVAEAVAQLRDADPVALLAQTGDTARRFFGVEDDG